jgi:hypothetical protein
MTALANSAKNDLRKEYIKSIFRDNVHSKRCMQIIINDLPANGKITHWAVFNTCRQPTKTTGLMRKRLRVPVLYSGTRYREQRKLNNAYTVSKY